MPVAGQRPGRRIGTPRKRNRVATRIAPDCRKCRLVAPKGAPVSGALGRTVHPVKSGTGPSGAARHHGRARHVWHLADVSLNPDINALPGGGTLQTLTNGLGAWALIAALVGLVIGAAAWALGVHAQNFQQSMVGRRAVLVSGLAALLIGAAPPIMNFFFHTGVNLH